MKKGQGKEYLIILIVIILVSSSFMMIFETKSSSKKDEGIQVVEKQKIEDEEIVKEQDNSIETKFDLRNASQVIVGGRVEVTLTDVKLDNGTLVIDGYVKNEAGEVVVGHVSKFYLKESDGNIINLDFFSNPRFNIQAPSGGTTKFQMIFENIELKGNKISVGGEFFIMGYFDEDENIDLEIKY